ncbi:uncharacterized protein LOC117057965 [Lacerta agilis]|uniref:uncharacterized protein LOC117057965 n=1 Tax=Lacerta agilis TaxID=80427 RepID=UPI001419CF68|nr:uncharacterized protein LOC117057965 [Lacerta agilis]
MSVPVIISSFHCSKSQDLNKPAEDNKSQDVDEHGEDDIRSLNDQSESDSKSPNPNDLSENDSKSQDPNDQSEGKPQDLTELSEDGKYQDRKNQSEEELVTPSGTSEPQSQDGKENPQTRSSRSWEKTATDLKDDLSSFLTTEPSAAATRSSRSFDSKLKTLKQADWDELQSSQDEEIPFSLWKAEDEWRDQIPTQHAAECKFSYHTHCCFSATEQMIRHSPVNPTKGPCYQSYFLKKQRAKFKRCKVSSSAERMQKAGRKEVKESKVLRKTQPPRTTSPSLRRSKVLYNLYTTFCDEGEQFDTCLAPGARGLSRACTIFGAIKKGKINISNLLLSLHTLGILLTKSEMYQALKFIPMDVHGNLDFADFLDILKTTPSFTEREALKNALFIFKNIRKDMVAIDDLETILACLGVTLSSKVIQHAVGSIRVTWDGKINISEFLSLVRGPTVCHKGLVIQMIRRPNGECCLLIITHPCSIILIMMPLLPSYGRGKINPRNLLSLSRQNPKARKMSLTESQEEEEELPFSVINYDRIQKQKKKKRLSFNKDLPRRYEFEEALETSDSESEGKKPSEAVSDEQALQNAFDILNTLAKEDMKGNTLQSTFHKMGVSVNEKEFQDVLQKAGLAKDGMVNFSNFVSALGKTSRITEFAMLKGAIQAINKIEGGKMVVHDLPAFARCMGVHLSDHDFKRALKQVPVDDDGKVVVKDFMKVFTSTPHFSDLTALKGIMKAVDTLRESRVSLEELNPTLKSMGIRLNPHEYEQLITRTSADRIGKIDIGQVLKKISKLRRFTEMEVLNNAIKTFSQFKDEKVKVSDVEACFRTIGVHLAKPELKQAIDSVIVSADGTVDVKELTTAMKSTRRFANFSGVMDNICALKLIKEHSLGESPSVEGTTSRFDLHMANRLIAQVLKSVRMTEAGQRGFINFLRVLTRNDQIRTAAALTDGFESLAKVENGKISMEGLQVVLNSFNIFLTPKDTLDALALCNVDGKKTVNLKDFFKGTTYTGTFITHPELQLTCMALNKLKGDHFNLHALESTLKTLDLPETDELLQEVMKTAQVDSHGRVNFREFMRVYTLLPELLEATVLKDTMNAMNNIRAEQVQVDDLPKTLANVGVKLTPEELQQLVHSVPVTGDGTVAFDEIIRSVTGTQSISEFAALQKAFDAISELCKEKIKKEELPVALEILGIRISPEELQLALTSVPIDGEILINFPYLPKGLHDIIHNTKWHLSYVITCLFVHLFPLFSQSVEGSGRLDGIEFLKVWFHSPHLFEFVALRDAIKHVESIRNKKMTVQQLEGSLGGMGLYLPNKTFNDIVKSVKTDENGQIYFKDFLLGLGETEDFIELEALQRAATIIDIGNNGWMQPKELQSTLDTLGIYMKHEEFQEIAKELMNDEGIVNVKDCLITLSKRQRYKDSLALQSAVVNFSKIRGEKVDIRDLESIIEGLGINLSNTEFQDALKAIPVDEFGRVTFKDFLTRVLHNERFSESAASCFLIWRPAFLFAAVQNLYMLISKMDGDKVEVSQLKDILAPIGILLTRNDAKEVLRSMAVKRDGMVKLKEFMNELPRTRRFSTAVEMEGAMKTMNSIKQGWVDTGELDSIMRSMGLNLLPDEIEQVLKNVTQNDDGKVSVESVLSALTKTRRFSQVESNKVPIENLDSILESVGIVLTKEEMQEVLKQVKVDEDGKVNLNEFMNSLSEMRQTLEGDQGDMVAMEEVGSSLSNLGIHLTEEQLQEALKYVTVNGE